MKDWTWVQGSQKEQPPEVEVVESVVYVRKNISQTANGDALIYQYEEKEMSLDEYAMYKDNIELKAQLEVVQESMCELYEMVLGG